MAEVTLYPTARELLRRAIAMRATDADDAAADLRTALFTLQRVDEYQALFLRQFYALYLVTSPHIEEKKGHKTICIDVNAALNNPDIPVLDIRTGGQLIRGLLTLYTDYKRALVNSNLLQVGHVEEGEDELFDGD